MKYEINMIVPPAIRVEISDAEIREVGCKTKEKHLLRKIVLEGEHLYRHISPITQQARVKKWDWMECQVLFHKYKKLYLSKLSDMTYVMTTPLFDRALFYQSFIENMIDLLSQRVINEPRRVMDDFLIRYS